MACNKPKEMRFRVFAYDLPKTVGKGGTIHESNQDSEYHDTGLEFTISEDEAKAALRQMGYIDHVGMELFSASTIPRVIINKMYGFTSSWPMYWTSEKDHEGYIGSPIYKCWHLKRVL